MSAEVYPVPGEDDEQERVVRGILSTEQLKDHYAVYDDISHTRM